MARLMTLLDLAGDAPVVRDLRRASIGADFEDEVPNSAVGADLGDTGTAPRVTADLGPAPGDDN